MSFLSNCCSYLWEEFQKNCFPTEKQKIERLSLLKSCETIEDQLRGFGEFTALYYPKRCCGCWEGNGGKFRISHLVHVTHFYTKEELAFLIARIQTTYNVSLSCPIEVMSYDPDLVQGVGIRIKKDLEILVNEYRNQFIATKQGHNY